MMKHIIYIVLITLLFSACKDEEEIPEPVSEQISSPTGKLWRLVSVETELGNVTQVYYSKNCLIDNRLIFYSSNKYAVNEGASICTEPDSVLYNSGLWGLSEKNSFIFFMSTEGTLTEGNILEVSSGILYFEIRKNDFSFIRYRFVAE